MPPFYPDQARPLLPETEAKTLFDQVDTIFHNTGFPAMPLVFFPSIFVLILFIPTEDRITLGSSSFIISMSLIFGFFVGILAIKFIMYSKRKTQVTQLIQDWNRTEGVPKAGVNIIVILYYM